MLFDARSWRVYVLTDPQLARGRSHREVVQAAISGGADAIQFRDKQASDADFLREARALRTLCAEAAVPFVVNDRVEIAIEVGADAVHVGQSDMGAAEVRRRIGTEMQLGVSALDVEQALRAIDEGADHLGVGPVFDATATKADADPAIGLEGLRAIRAACAVPLLAIGGIHHANAASVLRAGADGLAVISCITMAEDIAAAVRELKRIAHEDLSAL
jgi:thiamine-phosphate pyrophosphorylase